MLSRFSRQDRNAPAIRGSGYGGGIGSILYTLRSGTRYSSTGLAL